VLSILWHLAERWGRMTLDGVALPLTLSHRLLAQLIGARRPTVSTALGQLAARGEVVRLPGGSWLLKGTPPGQPDDALERFIPPRRRFIAAQRDEPDRVPPPELAERLAPVIAQPG
jgi:DNA-binding transcriptional MocR family regulator